MTVLLADCYGAHTPAEIKAAGFDGLMRYLSHTTDKAATPAEIKAYRDAGLIVGLNFEDAATNAQGGRGQGNKDGAFAAALAKSCGYPSGCVIPFSVDYEPTSADLATIVEYFAGVSGYGYPTIPYGNNVVLDAVCGAGHAPYGWQTTAWSNGVVSKYARILQDAYGSVYDTDKVLGTITLWGLDQSTAPIVTKTHPQEDPVYTEDLYISTDGKGEQYQTVDLPKGATELLYVQPFVKRRGVAPVGDDPNLGYQAYAGSGADKGTSVIVVHGAQPNKQVHVRATWR